MTEMCPFCGRAAEFDDGECSGCGAQRDANARGPRVQHRRSRRPAVFALGGVAAVIAVIALASSHSSGNDPVDNYDRVSDTSTPGWTPTATPSPEDAEFELKSNGKTYRCGESVLAQVHASRAAAQRENAEFKRRYRAVKRYDKRHPGRLTQAQARRYKQLFRSAETQLRVTNEAIDTYNGELRSLCTG